MESAGPLWSEVPKYIGVNCAPEVFLIPAEFSEVIDQCLSK